MNDIMRNIATPKLVMTAEYVHHVEAVIPEWRSYGLDLMRSPDDVSDLF